MFIFKDDVKSNNKKNQTFVLVGDKPAFDGSIFAFSPWFEQPNQDHCLKYKDKLYSSIAKALARHLNDDEQGDFSEKIKTQTVIDGLKNLKIDQKNWSLEGFSTWISSAKSDVIAVKRALQLNEILFKNNIELLLIKLMTQLIAANKSPGYDLKSLLLATGQSCIVYETSDPDFVNELACGVDGSGQNIYGRALMVVRRRLSDMSDNPKIIADVYKAFQDKRKLGTPIIEVLPVASDLTAPYVTYLVASAEAPSTASKHELVKYKERQKFLLSWLENQTKLALYHQPSVALGGAYSLSRADINNAHARAAAVSIHDDNKSIDRRISRSSILEVLSDTHKLNREQICVFQTLFLENQQITLPVQNPLSYSSTYPLTLLKAQGSAPADIQVIVSRVLIMRDENLALLPQGYFVDVVTAICNPQEQNSLHDILSSQYRAARLVSSKDKRLHVVIADLEIAETILKQNKQQAVDPSAQLATIHTSELQKATVPTLDTVTVLVHSGKLEMAFNLVSQPAEFQNRDSLILPQPKPVSYLEVSNEVVIHFLGPLKGNPDLNIRVYSDEKSVYFCFQKLSIACEYRDRLVTRHGFAIEQTQLLNSLSLEVPFNRLARNGSENLSNSHPAVVQLDITASQLKELAQMMENTGQFWHPFTQSLLLLFSTYHQFEVVKNEKPLFPFSPTKKQNLRKECEQQIEDLYQSLGILKGAIYRPNIREQLIETVKRLKGEEENSRLQSLKAVSDSKVAFLYYYNERTGESERKPPTEYEKICKNLSIVLDGIGKTLTLKVKVEEEPRDRHEQSNGFF